MFGLSIHATPDFPYFFIKLYCSFGPCLNIALTFMVSDAAERAPFSNTPINVINYKLNRQRYPTKRYRLNNQWDIDNFE